jgi:4-hydroxybenzoate polyprenyltransferase
MALVNFLKSVKDNFIHGGHLIIFGGVGIALTFVLLIERTVSIEPLIVIYLLGVTALLYNRYKEKETDFLVHPERTTFLKKYFKWILPAISLSLMVSFLILYLKSNKNALFFVMFWYLLMILYTIHLKKITSKIIGFKSFFFPLTISLILIFVSFHYSYDFFNSTFLIIFIFVFLRVFVNNVFLDIKDIENDRKCNLKTFPIILGPKKTISLLEIISLLSGLLIVISVMLGIIPIYSLMLLFAVPYSFHYFDKSKNFYLVNYVLADAEFLLWPISVIIGKNIL